MKQNDKFLIAIVIAVILLVVAAFAFVLLRPQPEYRTDDTPEAVVYNYLLALEQGDYERALDQIAKDVHNRPDDASEMEWDVKQNNWSFNRYGNPTLTIDGSNISGKEATVILKEIRSDDPFSAGVDSSEVAMRLEQKEDGWKLIGGQAYWTYKWDNE